MNSSCRSTILLTGAVLLSATAFAHHSTSANFVEDQMIEIEGTVTSARLRNPHVRFTVSVADDQGEEVEWLVETNSLSGLRRKDISTDVFASPRHQRLGFRPPRFWHRQDH